MCDKINTNIEDYSVEDLYALLSLSREIATKSMIQQQTDRLKTQFIDAEFHTFMHKVSDKLTQSLSKDCGYENNIINFSQDKQSHDMNLINPNNNKYYERNIVEKLLIVDTKYRDQFTTESATDFTVTLPSVIKNVISIQLSDIEFPNTWYPFDESKGNTFFHIKITTDTLWERIDISAQTYYFANLFSRINETLVTNNFSVALSLNLDFANAAGSPDGTATITIQSLNDEGVLYDFDFFSTDPNAQLYNGKDYGRCSRFLGWNLGFRNIEPMYYSKNTYYLSESTIDLGGPRYIYLIIDDHNKYMNESFIPFSKSMSTIKDTLNIFARISLQGSSFSLYNSNSFSVFSDIRKYNGLVDLSRMSIKLTDEYGMPLNLNNNDYSFTIRINTVQTT